MTSAHAAGEAQSGLPREITRFITDFPFDPADLARLSGALGEGRLLAAHNRDELVKLARAHPEADVMCVMFGSEDLMTLMPNLRWLALASAGADRVIGQPWATGPHAPIITTAQGVHATPITEHVFSSILLWSRKWPALMRLKEEHAWPPTIREKLPYAGRELEGDTLLVIGFGAIGRRIAQVAHAFGMRILATRRTVASGASDPDADLLAPMDKLDDLLAQADYVVIAAPSTGETRHMISAARLAHMKPTAMLINIARGELVDEPALIAALQAGRLGAAALDVLTQEPPVASNPLWSLPNVILSPHLSGITPRYSQRLTSILLDNIGRYRAGQPLRNLVQPDRGY